MSTVSYIQKLAATSSRLEKEQIILDAWMAGERDLFKGAQLAYDILMPFGVKKVAEIESDGDDTTVGTFSFSDFMSLADKLHRRELTGHAARDAIHAAAENTNTIIWNEFYRRVLLKDLRAGVTETTFNKILEKVGKSDKEALKYVIPVFSCQLAKDGADESNTAKITGIKMLDIKLDGVRLLTVLDKEAGTVTQHTRNGKLNENFPHIREIFEKLLPHITESLVFDGEITSKSFQELMTQVNRRKDSSASSTKLALFDVISLKDFQAGISKVKQKDRHSQLCGFINNFARFTPEGAVYVVPKLTVDLRTNEGKDAYLEFNRDAIEAGYEGIMVKEPESFYETKRTASWLKVKPFIEVSLTIVGFEEGEKGKAFEGSLGALICEGEDDGRQVYVKCGSGFGKDTIERSEIWNNRDKYLGFIVEIKADAFSLESGSDVWSLRFPRFKGFRGTEPGEKL